MPKGLVVYLDDDLHRRFRSMCSQEGLTLKDELYKMIKENVACFEWFSKEEAKRESHKPIELDNTGKQVHKLFGDAAA